MVEIIITPISASELEALIENSVKKILSTSTLSRVPGIISKTILNIDDAVKITRLSKSRLYVLAGTGVIPNFKKGGRIMFYEDELLRWIESGRRYSSSDIDAIADDSLISK